jgi:hypothetical protein
MSPERAQAYGRVMKTLADMGPAKLQPRERDVVREAADAMFFAGDLEGDYEAADALSRLGKLAARLVEADRWLFATADRLIHDVEACGPVAAPDRELALV